MQGVIDLALSDQNHDFPAGFVLFHAAMRGDDPVEGEDLSDLDPDFHFTTFLLEFVSKWVMRHPSK